MSTLKGLDGDLITGRELYVTPSITGLNRVPITILSSYILAKAEITTDTELPFTLEELTETLLVDGAYIEAVMPLVKKGEELEGVWAATRDSFTLHIEIEDATGGYSLSETYILREFTRTDSGWRIQDFENQSGDWVAVGNPGSAPPDTITYVYNPVCPVGVLSPAQVTYNRLEEIAVRIRRYQTGAGAKTLIYGNVRNRSTAVSELDDEDKDYAFVGGADIRADRMASTAAIDQLLAETARLQPLYYQQVHMVDTTSPVQRPSGSDRALVLGPMMRFVDAIAAHITRVLAVYEATWRFERIHTTDVLDRTQQLALLERQLALAVITETEFKERAGEL